MNSPPPVFGLRLSQLTADEIAARVVSGPPEGGACGLIVTPNLDHLVQLQRSAALKEAYACATFITPDGFPVMKYANLRGYGFKRRVTGHDILSAVMARLPGSGLKVFFVADRPETVAGLKAAGRRMGLHPEQLAFEVPPFGFEHDRAYRDHLLQKIIESRCNILIMGVGTPRSENYIVSHRLDLAGKWAMSVGEAVAVLAGNKRRAPAWIQRLNLEWLYRLLSDPRRLARRYLLDSWKVLGVIINDLIKKG